MNPNRFYQTPGEKKMSEVVTNGGKVRAYNLQVTNYFYSASSGFRQTRHNLGAPRNGLNKVLIFF